MPVSFKKVFFAKVKVIHFFFLKNFHGGKLAFNLAFGMCTKRYHCLKIANPCWELESEDASRSVKHLRQPDAVIPSRLDRFEG